MIVSVLDYIDETVNLVGEKIAIRDNDKTITFRELQNKAKNIATIIMEQNENLKNEPIPVLIEDKILSIATFLGVLYSGNYYVPIDIKLPDERIEKIFKTLQNKVILTDNLDKYEKLKNRMETKRWIKLKDKDGFNINELRLENIKKYIISTNPMYVLFTSGSTGNPKGVVVTHQSVLDYLDWLDETFEFSTETVIGNQAPFYFDNSVLDIYIMLKRGCELVLIDEESFIFPNKMIETISQNKINFLFWVPSAFNIFLRIKPVDIKSDINIKNIMFCGEVMPTRTLNHLKEIFSKANFVNMYGPTEITDVCTYYIVNREFSNDEVIPIGKACRNTEILVFDSEDKLILEPGKKGELCVRGISLAKGYYGDLKKTDEVFIQNPLNTKYSDLIYKTGDLVEYNEKEELIYLGRKDFQIKHLGYRIELGEIENAAKNITEVNECCCVYEKNKILLICSLNKKIYEKDIFNKLSIKLPKYMIPNKIFIVKEIIKTSNGKIDRMSTLKNTKENKI